MIFGTVALKEWNFGMVKIVERRDSTVEGGETTYTLMQTNVSILATSEYWRW